MEMQIPINLKERENMILYFSLKNKHGYSTDNRELFIYNIAEILKVLTQQYNNIVIPESSSDFLESVIKLINKPYIILEKNNIEYFKKLAPTLGLQKQELKSHLQRMDEMGDTFKINMLKASQRKKYIKYLFKSIEIDKNSVIIDDSNFTGSTKEALQFSTNILNYIPIFTKEG